MSTAVRAALEWLFSLQNRGVKLGLENVRALLQRLGSPEAGLRCVHVAGTNGKGSICAMLAAVARASGLRTGLFTSPHLVRFNERIQVNGLPIPDEAMLEGLAAIRPHTDATPVTFFEITTALAFWYFQRQKVDLTVLETGLGGRLDATNVVSPLAAVITPIDLDHQAILGPTRTEIAREKAGIIKPAVPVVSAPQRADAAEVLQRVADERGAPLRFVLAPVADDYEVGLFGSHQRLNAAVALAGLDAAGLHLPESAQRQGLRDVVWPGRFQVVRPGLVLDGAHNPAATERLVLAWREYCPRERPLVIFGGLRDKALAGMVTQLSGIAAGFFLAPVDNPRGVAPELIAGFVPPGVPHRVFGSAREALRAAELYPGKVLATGSLFLVGELLALLEGLGTRPQRSDQ
ncbi:MAG: bifunctional folylpolyglutamate synthase/dihydrofolate synthase [Verrucomicrobia bacterium]|nr:bifunctional folylpolyglutamate synthase/dihydrofolate synthase [Verrucomicrobiota bacterium]